MSTTTIEKTVTTDEIQAQLTKVSGIEDSLKSQLALAVRDYSYISEIINLGQMLTLKKQEVGTGHWLTWVAENTQKSRYTIARYMQISDAYAAAVAISDVARVQHLEGATSLRDALSIIAIEDTKEAAKPNTPTTTNPFTTNTLGEATWVQEWGAKFLKKLGKDKDEDWTDTQRADLSYTISRLVELAKRVGATAEMANKAIIKEPNPSKATHYDAEEKAVDDLEGAAIEA